jgi:hypothetical protein
VAVPLEEVPPLATAMVNRTIRQLRDRTLRAVLRRMRGISPAQNKSATDPSVADG